MTTMTADQFQPLPEPAGPSGTARQSPPARGHDLRHAGIIFGGIAVALGGIFGVLELSSRHSDKANDAIYSRLDTLQYSQNELTQRVSRLETSVDQRFNKVDERFEKLEAKMDKRFEQMDKRFEQVDRRIEQMDEKFEQKLERMTELLLVLVEQKAAPASAAAGHGKGNRSR